MTIAVLGGGHIGMTLAGYLSHLGRGDEIRLYTSKPEQFDRNYTVNDIERGISYRTSVDMISGNLGETIKGADMIFVTFPHFMIEHMFIEMRPFVKKGAYVGIIPGSGGCEFYWKKHYDKNYTLFGFQRVPFIARYRTYGKETDLKSWKSSVVVASIPNANNHLSCSLIERVCGFTCEKAPNFLAVTLTPSNPVLHTARIYDLFSAHSRDYVFPKRYYFYQEWTDHASEVMIAIDDELHRLFEKLPEIDLSAVKPLTEHYEAGTVKAMTQKITSLPTFQSILAPMTETEHGYRADVGARFFTEDYPYGLCIIKGFCEICGVETPCIDKVLKWYEQYMGVCYYVDDDFSGKDLIHTGIPQNNGINSIQDIYDFYL